jgi:hypothetical protein
MGGAFQANHLGNCEGRLLKLQDDLHFSGHSHFS